MSLIPVSVEEANAKPSDLVSNKGSRIHIKPPVRHEPVSSNNSQSSLSRTSSLLDGQSVHYDPVCYNSNGDGEYPHIVTSKRYDIPTVPRDAQGRPSLPLTVGMLTVNRLGEVCMREHFHTERYIFPVGYEVKRQYSSTVDPNQDAIYTCSIFDGGDGPKFKIVASDVPHHPQIAGTATVAWSRIIKQANTIRNRQPSISVSGPDFFGLGQNTIKHLIQELPNANRLREYVWQNFVEECNIPTVPRDARGRPSLPLTVGILTVNQLGEVCMREHFHTERYIFPVGYEVTRKYSSTVDPNQDAIYTCSIFDGGDGPRFKIVASDVPDHPQIAGTATGAWSRIAKQASAIRNRRHPHPVSGPDFFGLRQSTIKHLIQELPNAYLLHNYVWETFVEGGALDGKHAPVVPAAGKSILDCDATRHFKEPNEHLTVAPRGFFDSSTPSINHPLSAVHLDPHPVTGPTDLHPPAHSDFPPTSVRRHLALFTLVGARAQLSRVFPRFSHSQPSTVEPNELQHFSRSGDVSVHGLADGEVSAARGCQPRALSDLARLEHPLKSSECTSHQLQDHIHSFTIPTAPIHLSSSVPRCYNTQEPPAGSGVHAVLNRYLQRFRGRQPNIDSSMGLQQCSMKNSISGHNDTVVVEVPGIRDMQSCDNTAPGTTNHGNDKGKQRAHSLPHQSLSQSQSPRPSSTARRIWAMIGSSRHHSLSTEPEVRTVYAARPKKFYWRAPRRADKQKTMKENTNENAGVDAVTNAHNIVHSQTDQIPSVGAQPSVVQPESGMSSSQIQAATQSLHGYDHFGCWKNFWCSLQCIPRSVAS